MRNESDFQAGCPIATTLLETAPRSEPITRAGLEAVESWIRIVADVFERSGLSARAARQRAQLAISALEGAFILARVTRNTEPILNVARSMTRR
jgi:TetR/AcrR family transcriptional repressor of lmrAB and yxaGH operons